MIKRLRAKFILTAILAVFVVLVVIVGAIDVANYTYMVKAADGVLTVLTQNGGSFGSALRPSQVMGVFGETSFSARYFSLLIDNDGDILSLNMDNVRTVSVNDAIDITQRVLSKGREGGFYGNFRYKITRSNGYTLCVFLDCERDIASFNNFLLWSALFSALGLSFCSVLIYFFSGMIIRPVERADQKQKRFITDASHELKTPLTVILANTEVVEMENGRSEWTESTKKEVKKLAELTNDLVYLARMDEGTKLEFGEVDMTKLVEDSIDDVLPLAYEKEIEIKSNVEKGLKVTGNGEMLKKAVGQIISNALKYTTDKKVEILLKRTSKGVLFATKNECIGIKKGDHEEFFQRFYRADKSRNSSTGGHGIGLSVAESIVNAHKGKIAATAYEDDKIVIEVVL